MSEQKSRRRQTTESTAGKRPKKKLKKWPFVILLLAAGVFFAPIIVAQTSLKQKAIEWALGEFDGSVHVSSLTLNWFSPLEMEGVSVGNADDQTLFLCSKIAMNKSLVSLLFSSDYGEIDLHQPITYVQFRNGSSNVEDALASMFTESESVDSGLPKIKLNLIDARVMVSSNHLQQKTLEVNGFAKVGHERAPIEIEAEIHSSGTDPQAGALRLNCRIDEGHTELRNQAFAFDISAERATLDYLGAVLERFIGDAEISGSLSGDLKMLADSNGRIAIATGGTTIEQATFAATQLIGNDKLYAKIINLSGLANVSPSGFSADQFKLSSELGTVNANGQFDFSQMGELIANGRLLESPFQLDGQIDLAGAAKLLESTLQLHDDLQVESGQINFLASNRTENNSDRMVVNLDVANLQAVRGGQPVIWQNPMRLVGTLSQTDGQLLIENARCDSEFLTLDGNGSLEKGQFRIDGDLARLSARLGQFIKLDDMQLAGILNGTFGWDVPAQATGQPAPIDIGGNFTINNPLIKWPSLAAWQPESLNIQLRATGNADANRITIGQGGVQVKVGSEQLVSILRKPIDDVWTSPEWQMNCEATGRLAGWIKHISNFADMGTFETDGRLNLKCVATLKGRKLQLDQIDYSAEQFTFDGYGMAIREDLVKGGGNLVYDISSGWTAVQSLSATGASLTATGQNINVLFDDKIQVNGVVDFQADVNRIADWYGIQPDAESVKWFGLASGQLTLNSDENGIYGDLRSDINDLVASQKTKPKQGDSPMRFASNETGVSELWREQTININAKLKLAHDFDSFEFDGTTFEGNTIKMSAKGRVSDLANSWYTQASGTWNPNWQVVNKLLESLGGKSVKLSGNSNQPFAVAGPLFETIANGIQATGWVSTQMTADVGLKLNTVEAFSVPLGASEINVSLQNGIATLKAGSMPFAENINRLSPQIDLRSSWPMLTINEGNIINDVTLTPETCNQWLKYVAPLMAQTTQAQGTVSLTSGGANIPFENPLLLSARGSVYLKDVTVSAGTLTQQLVATADQLKSILKKQPAPATRQNSPWVQLTEQRVPFAVQEGRVYHEGLTFTHKEISFRTKGSVGFDQTIDLIAEIPVREEWIANEKWLAGLRGQSVSIPISGTVNKPVIDRRALQELSTQLIRSSAQSAVNEAVGGKVENFREKVNGRLEDELKKGFDKLFKKDN